MIKRIIAILLAVSVFCACYQDLSTVAYRTIPDIEISGIPDTLETLYGDDIVLEAAVTLGGEEYDSFSYEWAIDFRPGVSKDRMVIADTPDVTYRVANRPNDAPYCLSFTATDTQTGLSKTKSCFVYVRSSLGEGILVAHTRDGGATTDFDLITCKAATYGYNMDAPRYTRNIYSLANGEPLEGTVNAVLPVVRSDGAVYNETLILVGTDSHLYALDPLTFIIAKQDGTLFNGLKETTLNVRNLINYGQIMTAAQIGRQLYLNIGHTNNIFNKAGYAGVPSDVFTPTNVGYAYAVQQSDIVFFNEAEGRFYYMHSQFSGYGSFSASSEIVPADLSGGKSLWAGAGKNGTAAFLIEDRTGSHHIIYTEPTKNILTYYALDDSQWHSDVKYYAFCDNSEILFMASDKKIYSVAVIGGTPAYRELTWKPDDADEIITGIKFYTQGWYGTHGYDVASYRFQLPTNRLQIVISTYNESTGEGKIYLRPFNVSTGLFTFKDNGVYGGFGKITAITSTLK